MQQIRHLIDIKLQKYLILSLYLLKHDLLRYVYYFNITKLYLQINLTLANQVIWYNENK